MPPLNEGKPQTKMQELLSILSRSEERRRELIVGIKDSLSKVYPIQYEPTKENNELNDKLCEDCAITSLIGYADRIERDNYDLSAVLNTLRSLV